MSYGHTSNKLHLRHKENEGRKMKDDKEAIQNYRNDQKWAYSMKDKELKFISIVYPEIEFKNFCVCSEDRHKDVEVSLNIIARMPKEKLGEFVDALNSNWHLEGEDLPVEIILRPLKAD